jgi:DNA polymerase-3 subunit delta
MSGDRVRAHILLGPEAGQKGTRLKEIRAALRTEFGTDPEIHRFYPFETLNGEIITTLVNNSLFSDHRLVILSQAEELQPPQVKMLSDYLSSPSETATLVLISSQTWLPGKLTSLVPKDQVQVFWELFENRKGEWVRNLFATSGFAITADAVELLLELVENNTQELRSTGMQLMQFVSAEGSDLVTEETVELYIQHSRQESVFSLFEHICTGTYARALEILHTLVRSGEGDAIPLIAGLAWQFRRLVSLEELLGEDLGWDEAVRKAQVAGKAAPIKRKKDQETYRSAVERYPLPTSRAIIARLGEYDIRTREMGMDFQQLLLEHLLGIIMMDKGRAPTEFRPTSFLTDARF